MSVIVVGIILVLGIVAMLSNYHPTQTSPIVTKLPPPPINTTTIPPPHESLNVTKYTAYYNFLGALEGLNATSIYSFNSTKLFKFMPTCNTLAHIIANLLSLSANQITPCTYGEIYNILDSDYTEWASTRTVSLHYYPINLNCSTVYLNFTYQTDPQFVNAYHQLDENYPFPPSDEVSVGSPVCKIIDTYSVKTCVKVTYTATCHLAYSRSYSYKVGNITYVIINNYYIMNVHGTAYLYINGKLASSQSFSITFYWWGGGYGSRISSTVTVPPGVLKTVYGYYTVTAGSGFSEYWERDGNTIIITRNHYPTGPYVSTQGYTFNWYKYKVTLKIRILVFNGSNPITFVNSHIYYCRNITACVCYKTWSSLPESCTITIKTLDHINFLNYDLERTWCAGSITIVPKPCTQIDGNVINYYLGFCTAKNLAHPPSYIFNPIPPLNKTAVLQWSYFFNNYSVAQGLFNVVHKNIDPFNFVLPQLVTALFTNNLTEHTIILASFIEPWNVSFVTLSNVLVNSSLIFVPVNITMNSTYFIVYYALGSSDTEPNVTMISYEWSNLTADHCYFPPLQDPLYDGTIPPALYTPFTNKIWLNYGIYWPYGLPYAQFEIEQLEKVYNYWYNPGWPGWFPVS